MCSDFAGFETIHSIKFFAGEIVKLTLGVDHFDHFKIVALSDFEVILIVRRCHFEATGAELAVNIFVTDNGDFCPREGTPDRLTD